MRMPEERSSAKVRFAGSVALGLMIVGIIFVVSFSSPGLKENVAILEDLRNEKNDGMSAMKSCAMRLEHECSRGSGFPLSKDGKYIVLSKASEMKSDVLRSEHLQTLDCKQAAVSPTSKNGKSMWLRFDNKVAAQVDVKKCRVEKLFRSVDDNLDNRQLDVAPAALCSSQTHCPDVQYCYWGGCVLMFAKECSTNPMLIARNLDKTIGSSPQSKLKPESDAQWHNVGHHNVHAQSVGISTQGDVFAVKKTGEVITNSKRTNAGAWSMPHAGARLKNIAVGYIRDGKVRLIGVNSVNRLWASATSGATWVAPKVPVGLHQGAAAQGGWGTTYRFVIATDGTIYRDELSKKYYQHPWCHLGVARLTQISVHGAYLAGVNTHGNVWSGTSAGWDNKAKPNNRPAIYASQGEDGELWALTDENLAYRWEGGKWVLKSGGNLVAIDVANKDNIVGLTTDGSVYFWQ